jgi:CitMHS family citrate-Mg2+:H+ or citrate-Ca2+:H+ symporter
MLALLGLLTIVGLLAAIMSSRISPVAALILIPLAAALFGGFGLAIPRFMTEGVSKIAENAAMFVFAILYFGVMTDAGLIDPLVRLVLRTFGSRPSLIVPGSALLALLVHLDGSGAVCFLVTIPAMLPLYDRLSMDRRILACVTSLAAGVNFLPWTGPTIRASGALKIPANDIFLPMAGVQAVGLAFVLVVAFWLGRREEKRLGLASPRAQHAPIHEHVLDETAAATRRPNLLGFNVALTSLMFGVMVFGAIRPLLPLLPEALGAVLGAAVRVSEGVKPMVIFMVGAAIALVVNYPRAAEQRARIDAHAQAALLMASVLLAAGVFTGIMSGTGMLGAMAEALVGVTPRGMGEHMPFALSLVAMPLSLIFDPDSFYFGVLPILAHAHQGLGGQPIQMAQAALVGQMTTGFPISPLTPATFLVAGLCRLELGAHQRFAFPFLYGASLTMALACVAFGLFPI